MQCALRFVFDSRLGDAHHAAQLQAGQGGDGQRQRQRFCRQGAGFVGTAVNVDLQTHLQRRQMRRALLGQTLGNFEAIDAVYPIKVLGHRAGFVALQRANAVPLQIG